MTQFYDISFNDLSVSECDKIALQNAGILSGGFGYGYACPKGGRINDEYDSLVINTQGMGNHGTIVLRGRTLRARNLLREGKILMLTREGIPWVVARVAPSCPCGMEIAVVRLAVDLLDVVRVCGPFNGDSHRKFENWAGSWFRDLEMSFPRKTAAAHIAQVAVWRSGGK